MKQTVSSDVFMGVGGWSWGGEVVFVVWSAILQGEVKPLDNPSLNYKDFFFSK